MTSLKRAGADIIVTYWAQGARAMDETVTLRKGETAAHRELKRLTLLWAQAQGFSACALEVSLPRCRYRADVAAYRPYLTNVDVPQSLNANRRGRTCSVTAVVPPSRVVALKACSGAVRYRKTSTRSLSCPVPGAESLFAEWDSHDFGAIGHRNYTRVLRELSALQNQLRDGTKFEKLVQYRCANLFFLILPNELFRPAEIPIGWGALVEVDGALRLARKPVWHEMPAQDQAAIRPSHCGRRDRGWPTENWESRSRRYWPRASQLSF